MTEEDKTLVERLRMRGPNGGLFCECGDKAADRIEALSAENERLQLLCDLNAVPAGIIEDRGRMEERAAIVAWLMPYDPAIAEDIEDGAHLK